MEDDMMGQCRFPHGEGGQKILAGMNVNHRPQIKWGISNLPEGFEPKTILDVGCGGGVFSRLILERFPGARLKGIDLSELSIGYSEVFNADLIRQGRIELILGNVEKMPFADGEFDLVVSNDSHFFWPDVPENLKEVYRVLRPGGVVCFTANPHFATPGDIGEFEGQLNVILDDDLVLLFKKAGMDVGCFVEEGHCAFVGRKSAGGR